VKRRTSIHARARSHPRSLATRPIHFRVSASPSPAATRSHSVTRLAGEACRPRAHPPLHSPAQPQCRKARARPRVGHMKRAVRATQRPLLHHLPLAHPSRPSLPARAPRAHRTRYAASPCPHATQLTVRAAVSAQPLGQILFLLHQQVVSQLRGHDKHSSNPVGIYAQLPTQTKLLCSRVHRVEALHLQSELDVHAATQDISRHEAEASWSMLWAKLMFKRNTQADLRRYILARRLS
jgi:hypothetical protein